ncbi:hypothetical protein [Rhizobium sp. BK491]|uniref:hypothetical protein n=1 Tax=Rhizobium sp. BK491 TaxID=2587009 RepID=UPI001617F9C6|nr:hypothetical protein [Rhizobium sp. BK491]MBB3571816.1 hypothetical protein [Rhizobium sp. BK491]
MRQTHDVAGSVAGKMNDLADRLKSFIAEQYPPALQIKTMMAETALVFPGLTDRDLLKLVAELIRMVELDLGASTKVIPFPRRRMDAGTERSPRS